MNRIEILREKITKLVGLLTDRKVSVTQRGVQAYVQWDNKTGLPKVVNIPYIPDNATQEFTQAIEGFLDHEIGHVLFTDSGIVGEANRKGVAGFHNAIEDIFIERAMGKQFPGSVGNIETMHHLFIRDYVELNYQKNKDKPIEYLIISLLRSYADQRAFVEYIAGKMAIPEIEDVDKKLSKFCREAIPKMKSSRDALDIALEIKKLLTPPPQPKQPPPPEPPQEEKKTGGSGDTPEDEGKQGPSTKESEPKDDEDEASEPPPVGNESQDESEGANDKQENQNDGESDDEQSDERESANNEGEGEDSPPNGAESENDEADAGDKSDPSDNDSEAKDGTGSGDDEDSEGGDSTDDESGDITGDNEPSTEGDADDAGDSTADNGDSASGSTDEVEVPKSDEPVNESAGEDEQSSDGEPTESEEGEAGEGDSGTEGTGEGGDTDPDGTEPIEPGEMQPADTDNHHDLDANAMTVAEFEKLQSTFKDFDEAMSELITREAIEVASHSDYLIYSRDFDKVEKYDVRNAKLNSGPANPVEIMQEKVDHMVGKMQRDLERAIAAQNKVQWTPNHRSGRLNGAALGRLIQFHDEKVFKRKEETKSKNAAVTLLIDCSGSMEEYNKITTAAYTAYALSSTLERIGVNHEILGFTTQPGYCHEAVSEMQRKGTQYSRVNNLYIPIFKSFGERPTALSKLALATLGRADWLQNNVDGESLAIAAQRLSTQKEERKILIVLSDGNPVASGGDGNKGEMRAHLKKTVKDITMSGIEVLGIGIMDDAVKSYYPKHLVIEKLADLPSTIIGKIRQLLL